MDIEKAIEWQEKFKKAYKSMSQEADEACDFTIAALKELQRWHTDRVNEKIKNPFANTSTSICHNCDHKDEYIEELEYSIEEYEKIGTLDECRTAREKQIPKEPKRVHIEYGKHKWKRKENGEIDTFTWASGFCNGVTCEICGMSVCVHCNPNYDKMEDCEDNYFLCPDCGEKHYTQQFYCKCGQALKWGD